MKTKTKITWGLLTMMAVWTNTAIAEGAPSPFKEHLICVDQDQNVILHGVFSHDYEDYRSAEGKGHVTVKGKSMEATHTHHLYGLRFGSDVEIKLTALDPIAANKLKLEVAHGFFGADSPYILSHEKVKEATYKGHLSIPDAISEQDEVIPVQCKLINFNQM